MSEMCIHRGEAEFAKITQRFTVFLCENSVFFASVRGMHISKANIFEEHYGGKFLTQGQF